MRKVEFVHHTRSRKKGNRRRPSRGPVDQGGRQLANLVVEISQDLLAVGMTDGIGANTRTDHPQGRLVQVGRQHVARARFRPVPRAARKPPNGATPEAARWAAGGTVSALSHTTAQVVPRASNCSPISRLAVRIDGGTIEASARRFSATRSSGLPARAPRQPDATRMPSSGPSDVRSHRRVQRSRLSAS